MVASADPADRGAILLELAHALADSLRGVDEAEVRGAVAAMEAGLSTLRMLEIGKERSRLAAAVAPGIRG
jgi:hypothetical protein